MKLKNKHIVEAILAFLESKKGQKVDADALKLTIENLQKEKDIDVIFKKLLVHMFKSGCYLVLLDKKYNQKFEGLGEE